MVSFLDDRIILDFERSMSEYCLEGFYGRCAVSLDFWVDSVIQNQWE